MDERPYAVADLLDAAGLPDVAALAHRLGRRTDHVADATSTGFLSTLLADRWAVRLGYHPGNVWTSWFEDGLADLDRLWPLDEWWRPAWLWAQLHAEHARFMQNMHDPTDDELAAIEAEAA